MLRKRQIKKKMGEINKPLKNDKKVKQKNKEVNETVQDEKMQI